jgi:hypothetical protein
MQPWGYRAALCATVLISLCLLASLAGLWATHWVLLVKGATTWDMIRAHLEPRRPGSGRQGSADGDGILRYGGGSGRAWVRSEGPACGCGGVRVVDADAVAAGQGQQAWAAYSDQGAAGTVAGGRGRQHSKRVAISPFTALRIEPRLDDSADGGHGRLLGTRGAGLPQKEPGGFDAAAAGPVAGSAPISAWQPSPRSAVGAAGAQLLPAAHLNDGVTFSVPSEMV